MTGSPRLNWALLPAFDLVGATRIPADLARCWQVAEQSLELVAAPIPRFELAGTLNGHPGHVASDEAKLQFPAIFALAVAGCSAAQPLRDRSQRTAAAALLSWAQVYQPTGNPIDEWFFVPLLQAADLVAATVPAAAEAALLSWAAEFAAANDRFYGPLAAGNPARSNNWMARRLLIRTVASTVAGRQRERAELPAMLAEFAGRNFVAGPAGRPDGRTFDFVQRDALHYHLASVQPLIEVLLYAPDLVGPSVRAAVLSGLEFLRPFFLGEREHIEFARTTIAFDRERQADGTPPSAMGRSIRPAAGCRCGWRGLSSPRSAAGPSR